MSDHEINIAIAEVVGWTLVKDDPDFYEYWEHPKDGRKIGVAANPFPFPNYPADLNACAEFEATLTDDELWEYSKLLMDYRQAANGFPLASRSEVLKLQKATARQRAEAFLRAIGKWKEAAK